MSSEIDDEKNDVTEKREDIVEEEETGEGDEVVTEYQDDQEAVRIKQQIEKQQTLQHPSFNVQLERQDVDCKMSQSKPEQARSKAADETVNTVNTPTSLTTDSNDHAQIRLQDNDQLLKEDFEKTKIPETPENDHPPGAIGHAGPAHPALRDTRSPSRHQEQYKLSRKTREVSPKKGQPVIKCQFKNDLCPEALHSDYDVAPKDRLPQGGDRRREVTCMTFNCHSVVKKDKIVGKYLRDEKMDFAILTETWYSDDKQEQIITSDLNKDGYTLYVRNRQNRSGGGIALACTDRICVTVKPGPSQTYEYGIWKLVFEKCSLLVIGIYRPPKSSKLKFMTEFFALIKKISEKFSNILVMGDFNLVRNKRFRCLLSYSQLEQFVTFSTHRRGNILDQVITETKDNVIVRSCEKGPSFSDHFVVKVTLTVKNEWQGPPERNPDLKPPRPGPSTDKHDLSRDHPDWRSRSDTVPVHELSEGHTERSPRPQPQHPEGFYFPEGHTLSAGPYLQPQVHSSMHFPSAPLADMPPMPRMGMVSSTQMMSAPPMISAPQMMNAPAGRGLPPMVVPFPMPQAPLSAPSISGKPGIPGIEPSNPVSSVTEAKATSELPPPETVQYFEPVRAHWQREQQHNFPNLPGRVTLESEPVRKAIGKPSTFKTIGGDGNCFFRCISYLITGNEESHSYFRAELIKHMDKNQNLWRTLINMKLSVQEYIIASKMKYDMTWATQVEIFAMAHMLKTSIYVYSNVEESNICQWLQHYANLMDIRCTPYNQNIYLNHKNRNHYEVVLDVESPLYQIPLINTESDEDVREEKK